MKPSFSRWGVAMMLALLAGARADLSKPIPSLRLPDGRILKNAQVMKFRAMDVTVKHAGGFAVVRYEALPEAVRIEAERQRPGGPRYFPGEMAAEKQTVEGQVFIQTQGAGPYKFGDVTVYAFAMDQIDAWKQTTRPVLLPRPLAETVTDADGKFRITVPKDKPFFLFAQALRRMPDGDVLRYEWRAPSNEMKRMNQVNLATDWRHPFTPVKIEETP